jgi:hypothetical protein
MDITLGTLKTAVGCIIVSREPLHVDCLQELLGITKEVRLNLVKVISSFFPVRDHRLHVYHKSVADWLLDENNKFHADDLYEVDTGHVHTHLAKRCREFIEGFKAKGSSKGLYEYAEQKLTSKKSGNACMEGLTFALRHGVYHGVESASTNGSDTLEFWRSVLLRSDWLISRALLGDGLPMKQDCELYLSAIENDASTPSNRAVHYVMRCLGLALGGLAQNPQQICAHLVGRLMTLEKANGDIKALLGALRDFRGYEWWCPLNAALTQANDPCITVISGHDDLVSSVAYSKDGAFVASGSWRTVRIWNASTGEEVHVLKGHDDEVTSVAYSKDGAFVASGSRDETVRIWNASTGEEVHVLKGHDAWVRFSSDFLSGVIVGSLNAEGLAVLEGTSSAEYVNSRDGSLLTVYYGHKVLLYQVMNSGK